MPNKRPPKMSDHELDELFATNENLKRRNARFRNIVRSILVHGMTQRVAAKENGVTHIYVNTVMRPVMQALRIRSVPPGYVVLDDIILSEDEAIAIRQKSRRNRELLQKQWRTEG